MILIITHKQDFTADFIIEKLNQRSIDYYRFNCENLDSMDYSFQNRDEFSLLINNCSKFNSVWFRRTKLPEVSVKDEGEKLFILGDYDSLLDNMFSNIHADRWLSTPKYVYESENKLLQLKIASELGFSIPNFIVTQSKQRLKEFIKENDENVIIKPIRQGRINSSNGFKTIFTNKLSREQIDNIDDFDLTPCIFQQYIDKSYELRITVVNNRVFSARVDSQEYSETSIDWRKKKIPFQSYILPEKIREKCIQLLNRLNLSFGAIDLIRDVNGEYFFLEINPNGQWAWIEIETGLPISDEIINFLTTES